MEREGKEKGERWEWAHGKYIACEGGGGEVKNAEWHNIQMPFLHI